MRWLDSYWGRLGLAGGLLLGVEACAVQIVDESRRGTDESLGQTAEAVIATSASVLTHRNDTSRSGAYLAETTLTPANVGSSFGKLYERTVRGDIYAQPLYARGVTTASGTKNMVYVATSTNDVYAFDGDNNTTDSYGALLWHRNINPWRPLVLDNEICGETRGSVGVTSTPVIDPSSQTMYVVTRRSGGRVVASGGALYQFHNSGSIWQYTGTPCSGTSCQGWTQLDNNPAAVQVTAATGSLGLFQLHRTGLIWGATGAPCSGNSCPGWTVLDSNPLTVHVEAAGISGGLRLAQLREDGSILDKGASSTVWTLEDNNPATTQIALATTTGGGTQLYQMHRNGSIWLQTGARGWTMLDSNPAAVQIAAAGGDLYELQNTGGIWKYTGVPCSSNGCPGWQLLDVNPAATKIVAAPLAGQAGSTLYQLHDAGGAFGNDAGSIWKYTGVPCSSTTNCSGWQELGMNYTTADIVADNTVDLLYQVQTDGTILKYTGVPCSGNVCNGWQKLDSNWALNDGANYLHAINIADGTERMPPVLIGGADPLNSAVTFDARAQRNRPALLLLNGVVYTGFATFSCDQGTPDGKPYHGWLFGYRASDFKQVAAYDTSGDGGGAGIWQSGGGLVGGSDGSIYFETGNDTLPHARLGDSFVKLTTQTAWPGVVEAAHFAPVNAAVLRDGGTLSAEATKANAGNSAGGGDTDLGSGGPMLLPNGRLIGGGKQGRYYVLNTATMQLSQNAALDIDGFDGFQAFLNTWHGTFTHQDYEMGELWGPNIHAGPVYFPGTGLIYQMAEKDYLKGFLYNMANSTVGTTAAVTAAGPWSRPPDGMPGGASSISANGSANGIVWTNLPQADGQSKKVAGVLAAFDAITLTELWSDSTHETYAKFTPPTIADGKVYRATFDSNVYHGVNGKLIAYGLLSTPVGAPATAIAPTGALQARTTISSAAVNSATAVAPNPIADLYWSSGGPDGELGKPQGQEQAVGDAAGGRYQNFVSSAGRHAIGKATSQRLRYSVVYWTAATGAHIVSGEILALWQSLGAEQSTLGYPISDETNTSDASGRVSRFQRGEIIADGRTSPVAHQTP